MNPKRNLRFYINLTIIGAWFLIFIIQIYCIGMLHNQIVSDEKENIYGNMLSAHDFIKKKIDTAKTIQESIFNNSKVMKSLQNETYGHYDKLKNAISEMMLVNHSITHERLHIIFLDKDNTANCVSGEIPDEVMQKTIEFSQTNRGGQLDFFTATTPLFTVVYFCTSQQVTFPSTHNVDTEYMGTFIIVGQINTAELLRQSSINEFSYVYLTNSSDKKENIVISAKSTTKKNVSLLSQTFSDTGWQIGIVAPLNFPTPPIFMMFLFEIALLPLVFLFIQRLITYNLYKPIDKIYDFLSNYPKKRNHSRLKLKNQTEIGVIANKIDDMLDETEQLYHHIITTQQALYEKELIQKNTTLYALQAQLVPHFIYNTLDCICGLANTSGVPQIADIVVSLSKMLRYSIADKKEVLFIQELELLEHYITIQTVMLPNRFDVLFDVSNETHSIHCLKMIVQPIVENAFKHAFRNQEKKYLLKISAYIDDKFLVVKIRDNGCGITDEKLGLIKKELYLIDKTFFVEKTNTHIGISNIQYRILLNYGKDYGIDIDSKENEYTEVTLYLPNNELP